MKMNLKSKLRMIIVNLLLFALLFGIIFFNKFFLRPNFNQIPFMSFLTGCFPNFISAYLISLFIVNPVLIRKPKHGKHIVYVSAILIFAILTIEELMPMWGASTQFDTFDIIASGLGSILAILTFELLIKERNKVKTPFTKI